jgi:hypothetical protein
MNLDDYFAEHEIEFYVSYTLPIDFMDIPMPCIFGRIDERTEFRFVDLEHIDLPRAYADFWE